RSCSRFISKESPESFTGSSPGRSKPRQRDDHVACEWGSGTTTVGIWSLSGRLPDHLHVAFAGPWFPTRRSDVAEGGVIRSRVAIVAFLFSVHLQGGPRTIDPNATPPFTSRVRGRRGSLTVRLRDIPPTIHADATAPFTSRVRGRRGLRSPSACGTPSGPSTRLRCPVHLARPGGHGRRAHHRPPGLPDHPRPFTRAVHRASSPRPRFDPRSVLREHREVRDPESKTEGKIKKVCQLVSK